MCVFKSPIMTRSTKVLASLVCGWLLLSQTSAEAADGRAPLSYEQLMATGRPAGLFELVTNNDTAICEPLLTALNSSFRPADSNSLTEPEYLMHTGYEATLEPSSFPGRDSEMLPYTTIFIVRQSEERPVIALSRFLSDAEPPQQDNILLLDRSYLSQTSDGGPSIKWTSELRNDSAKRHELLHPNGHVGDQYIASIVNVSSKYVGLVTTPWLFNNQQNLESFEMAAFRLDWEHLDEPVCKFVHR